MDRIANLSVVNAGKDMQENVKLAPISATSVARKDIMPGIVSPIPKTRIIKVNKEPKELSCTQSKLRLKAQASIKDV